MWSHIIRGKSWCFARRTGRPGFNLTKPERELLRPLPEGSLDVETVREGSD
jgi:hypothetical protein